MKKIIDQVWANIGLKVVNVVKIYLLEKHVKDIILFFGIRLVRIVKSYSRTLPIHVIESELDDLKVVSQLELLETLKAWDPINNEDIWPLAYSRITGAMRDHIRHLSRSDPTRVYDWIVDSANDYISSQTKFDYVKKVETGDQIDRALAVLNDREKVVVISHTKSDYTFKVIGQQIGLSESQVSRIYKKAIEKMRKVMVKE